MVPVGIRSQNKERWCVLKGFRLWHMWDKCLFESFVLIFVFFTGWTDSLTRFSRSALSSKPSKWSCGSSWSDSCPTLTRRFHSAWKLILPIVSGAQDQILLYHSLSKHKKLIMDKQGRRRVWIGFHSRWTWHWELMMGGVERDNEAVFLGLSDAFASLHVLQLSVLSLILWCFIMQSELNLKYTFLWKSEK